MRKRVKQNRNTHTDDDESRMTEGESYKDKTKWGQKHERKKEVRQVFEKQWKRVVAIHWVEKARKRQKGHVKRPAMSQ